MLLVQSTGDQIRFVCGPWTKMKLTSLHILWSCIRKQAWTPIFITSVLWLDQPKSATCPEPFGSLFCWKVYLHLCPRSLPSGVCFGCGCPSVSSEKVQCFSVELCSAQVVMLLSFQTTTFLPLSRRSALWPSTLDPLSPVCLTTVIVPLSAWTRLRWTRLAWQCSR